MKYALITMLAQLDDDAPLPEVPVSWPEQSYWTADVFDDAKDVEKVLKGAQIAMGRKIAQDGMPGC